MLFRSWGKAIKLFNSIKLTIYELNKVEANIVGIILNKFKPENNNYYSYYSYYGYYDEEKKGLKRLFHFKKYKKHNKHKK